MNEETDMSDSLHNNGGPGRTRINVNEDLEVRTWADRFGVTPNDVRDAIKAVGDRVDDVQEYLHSHHSSPGI